MLFVGCAKEQSSFNVEDIPGRATIVGSFYYDAGQGYSSVSKEYVQYVKPLANHTVYAQVSITLDSNSKSGDVVYETTTNANGEFEISVPATLKGVEVNVYPKPFRGQHSVVVGVENNVPTIEAKDVVYKNDKKKYTLFPNDIQFHDAICTATERTELETYPEVVKFKVQLYKNASYGSVNASSDSSLRYYYETAQNVDVFATIDNKKYAATTSGGVATFAIPAKKKSWTTTATIEIAPYAGKLDFYYYDTDNYPSKIKNTELTGYYKMYKYLEESNNGTIYNNQYSTSVEFSELPGKPVHVVKIAMMFYTYETFSYYKTSLWSSAINDIQ